MRTLFSVTMKIRLFVVAGMLCLLVQMCVRAADLAPAPAAEKKPVSERILRHQSRGRLSVAGKRQRRNGEGVVGRGEQTNTRLSRRTVGSERDREATHRMVREDVTELFFDRGPAGEIVRNETPAAQATADAGDFDFGGRFETEKVLVDPNKIDSKGTTAIDWFEPSLDGTKVAVPSQRASEDGTLHFFDTAAGKQLADTIAHVQYPTAGGSAAWNADGTGVYYTRFPRKGERPEEDLNFYQQVYFHKLGTPDSADTYAIGKEFPRIAEVKLESSGDGKYILATVANGDGGDFAHYLLGPDGAWKQVTKFSDHVKLARLGRDNALYLLSRAGAPRGKILRLSLATPELSKAVEIVPQARRWCSKSNRQRTGFTSLTC